MPIGGLFKDCIRPKIKNYNGISVMKNSRASNATIQELDLSEDIEYQDRIRTSGMTLMNHENTMVFFHHYEYRRFRRLIISVHPCHLKGVPKQKYTAPITPIYY